MIIAASTSCIPGEPLTEIFERLADLAYTSAELVIGEEGVIVPSQIAQRHDSLVQFRKTFRRIVPVALYFDVEPDAPDYTEHFTAACRLAKDCNIAVTTVHTSIPGTPFNEEIDRLANLVKVGMYYGVVVGIATEAGRISDTPETVGSLCKYVKGLGVSLDPSHYIYKQAKPKDYESILPNVCHVRLRDTTSKDFQTRVGQGVVDFGRLIALLANYDYRRVLSVDLAVLPSVDSSGELRKMRLLLESSL